MSTTRIGIYSPGVGNTLGGFASHWHLFTRRWQHTRGLRLALASIRPALATRSGASPRIDIYSPGVGNTLGGCTSNWHSFAPALVTRSGTVPYNPMPATLRGYAYMLTLAFTPLALGVDNTLGGCVSHTANLSRPLHCLLHLK
jgi:hypothetical protein